MTKDKLTLSRASVVRLILCQALCMYEDNSVENKNIDEILESINEYYVKEYLGKEDSSRNDYKSLYKTDFLKNMFKKTIEDIENINNILEKEIRNFKNTIDNLFDTTRSCFKLAIYEMLNFNDIPSEIIVSEYVDIVAEFTNDENETKFANRVLENLAVKLRNKEKRDIDNEKVNINKGSGRKIISLHKNLDEKNN